MGDVIERVFEHCNVYLNVASPKLTLWKGSRLLAWRRHWLTTFAFKNAVNSWRFCKFPSLFSLANLLKPISLDFSSIQDCSVQSDDIIHECTPKTLIFLSSLTRFSIYLPESHQSHQIKSVFLQWLPWILRMGRPGKKITRKTIMLSNRMKELELKERSSKSLLANVLDIDDDFRHVSGMTGSTTQIGSTA